jgi:hypothetical protein
MVIDHYITLYNSDFLYLCQTVPLLLVTCQDFGIEPT